MDNLVVQFVQRRFVQQFPQDIAVLHLGESQHVGHVALLFPYPEQGLGDGLALGLKTFLGPMPLAERGELRIGHAEAVVVVVEEVLQVPKKDPHVLRPRAESHAKKPYDHYPFHGRKMEGFFVNVNKETRYIRKFFLFLIGRKVFLMAFSGKYLIFVSYNA